VSVDDKVLENRPLTIPEEMPKGEKEVLKQTPLRIHRNDHTLLKATLKKDGMSIQKFFNHAIRAYLDAEPNMLRSIRYYREIDAVPKDVRDKHLLSQRERANLLDEIEKGK
jgi:hypothetical protein